MVLSQALALAGTIRTSLARARARLERRLVGVLFTASATRPLAAVNLPDDELQHTGLVEWWYFKGHFEAAATATDAARRYSFIATVLKRDLLFVPTVLGLFRLTDHSVGPRALVVHPSLAARAYSETKPLVDFAFAFPARNWPGFGDCFGNRTSLQISSSQTGFVQTYRVVVSGSDALDLTLSEKGPAALLGQDGVVSYPGGASLAYYARPCLALSGSIVVDGVSRSATGSAWMERQFGGADVDAYQWSYFPLQLDSGERYLFYSVTHRATRAVETVGLQLTADGVVTLGDATIAPLARVFDHGGVSYPLDHRLSFRRPDGSLDAFVVSALFPDQLIDARLPGVPPFYEGPSRVTNDAGVVLGSAMTELVLAT